MTVFAEVTVNVDTQSAIQAAKPETPNDQPDSASVGAPVAQGFELLMAPASSLFAMSPAKVRQMCGGSNLAKQRSRGSRASG